MDQVQKRAAALIAGAVAIGGLALALPTTASGGPAPTASAAPAAVPGTDPGIQRWFKTNEKLRITFNDQLLKAEQEIAAQSGTANCSALADTTAKVVTVLTALQNLPRGGGQIAAAYLPPMQKFSAVAVACRGGDYATAASLLGTTASGAVAEWADAQAVVDEILDGGA